MTEITRTYPQGVSCWIDTGQPDLDAAVAFYGGLFGWTFENAMPPDAPSAYLIAQLDGRDVAAIGSADGPVAWTTYFAVDDADASAAAANAALGEVLVAPQDAGPGGRLAVIRDPQGAVFRLWQARKRLGAQAVNMPGTWNFSDLFTSDVAGAQSFYSELFGWHYLDLGESVESMIAVDGYGDHLEATADPDIRRRQQGAPEGFADAIGAIHASDSGSAEWHVKISVASRADSMAVVEALGGAVLGTEETPWADLARVRDPQGAEFTISEFVDPR